MNKVIKDHGRLIILAISLSAIGAYFAVPATFGAVKDSGNVIQSITQSNSITAVNTGQYGGAVQANDNTQINEASNTADVNISPSYSGTSDNSAPATTTPTTTTNTPAATTTTGKPATTTSDNTPQKASTDTTTKKPDSSASDNNNKKSTTHDDSKLSDSIKNKISELKDKISSEVKQKVSDAEKKASSSQDSTKNNNN